MPRAMRKALREFYDKNLRPYHERSHTYGTVRYPANHPPPDLSDQVHNKTSTKLPSTPSGSRKENHDINEYLKRPFHIRNCP